MSAIKDEIIKTLLYFDIFSFPLTKEEIHRYCHLKTSPSAIVSAVKELKEEGQVQLHGRFYALRDGKKLARLREKKFRLSTEMMKRAKRNAALLSHFPFVRGVAISGSLSKYSADESADIDFFIIAKSRRLWICRSFLHLFKKLTFLFGKQHDFCMNYFLDQDELELKDKNLYTAFESFSILPVFGKEVHQTFYQKNEWAKQFYPNCDPYRQLKSPLLETRSLSKGFLESLFFGQWGNWINKGIQKLTVNRWRKKFRRKGFEMKYFESDLRATSGESKYHPNDYQRIILAAYEERLEAYYTKLSMTVRMKNR